MIDFLVVLAFLFFLFGPVAAALIPWHNGPFTPAKRINPR